MKSYRAFLLRCWSEPTEPPEGPQTWRFLVLEIGIAPQAPRGFADLEGACTFLAHEIFGAGIDHEELSGGASDSQFEIQLPPTPDEKGPLE